MSTTRRSENKVLLVAKLKSIGNLLSFFIVSWEANPNLLSIKNFSKGFVSSNNPFIKVLDSDKVNGSIPRTVIVLSLLSSPVRIGVTDQPALLKSTKAFIGILVACLETSISTSDVVTRFTASL